MNGTWTRKFDPLTLRRWTEQSGEQILAPSPNGTYQRTIYSTGNKRLRPKGQVALFTSGTALQYYESWTRGMSPGTVWDGSKKGFTEHNPLTYGLPVTEKPLAPNFGAAKSDALVRARGYIVNLALMMAEYREAAALATQLLKMVVALSSPRRVLRRAVGRWQIYRSGLGSLSEDQANMWLMYQYGIVPTMNDILAISKYLGSRVDPPPLYRLLTGARAPLAVDRRVQKGSVPTTYCQYDRQCQTRASVLVNFPQSALTSTFANLGLTNPLSLVFERIPLSFVADWVCNIGDSIASLDNPLVLGQSVLIRYDYKQENRADSKYFGGTARGFLDQKFRGTPAFTSTLIPLRYEPSISARRLLSAVTLTRQRTNRSLFLEHPGGQR